MHGLTKTSIGSTISGCEGLRNGMLTKPLPTIEGIGPSCMRLPHGPWKNILEYMEVRFPDVATLTWISRMGKGTVVDEKGIPLHPESPYRIGAFVYYYRELEWENPIPFEESILFQDNHIVVADKPHFLPVVPSGQFLQETLLVRLKKRLKLENLVPIHRIDRETAGVVMFSQNPRTRGRYATLFHKHQIQKVYEALAPSLPRGLFPVTYRSRMVQGEPFFRMKEIEGAPNSETTIDIIANMGDTTLYRLIPVTGRKHQIRVHCAALGIPIINDKLYPVVKPSQTDDFSSPLQLLARSVSFQDPLTGQHRYFQSRCLLSRALHSPG